MHRGGPRRHGHNRNSSYNRNRNTIRISTGRRGHHRGIFSALLRMFVFHKAIQLAQSNPQKANDISRKASKVGSVIAVIGVIMLVGSIITLVLYAATDLSLFGFVGILVAMMVLILGMNISSEARYISYCAQNSNNANGNVNNSSNTNQGFSNEVICSHCRGVNSIKNSNCVSCGAQL